MKKENTIDNYIVENDLDMPKVFEDYYHYVSTIIKNKQNINIEDEEEIGGILILTNIMNFTYLLMKMIK